MISKEKMQFLFIYEYIFCNFAEIKKEPFA